MSGTNFSLFLAAALIIAAIPGPGRYTLGQGSTLTLAASASRSSVRAERPSGV